MNNRPSRLTQLFSFVRDMTDMKIEGHGYAPEVLPLVLQKCHLRNHHSGENLNLIKSLQIIIWEGCSLRTVAEAYSDTCHLHQFLDFPQGFCCKWQCGFGINPNLRISSCLCVFFGFNHNFGREVLKMIKFGCFC